MKQQKSLAKKPEYSLSNPDDVIKFAAKLKVFIQKAGLSTSIKGSEYVLVDGWKFAGLNFGLTALVDKPELLSKPGEQLYITYATKPGKVWVSGNHIWGEVESITSITGIRDQAETDRKVDKFLRQDTIPFYKYGCDCKIIRISNREEVSNGYALCSNAELIKAGFDEYAVFSMAQTRAIAKGYRNLIGFVMKAAGYSDTPAEEAETLRKAKDEVPPHAPNATTEQIIKTVKENAELQTNSAELTAYWKQLPETTRAIPECKNLIRDLGVKLKHKEKIEKKDELTNNSVKPVTLP